MNDYTILENLFKNEQDEIHFELFKESNVIKINNNSGDNNNFDNGISFNTQAITSKMINYKDAYVLLHIECEIPFDQSDQGKKSIPKLLYLKNSFEIVKNLKVQFNNVTILNEGNVNRSSLIDFVLDNSQRESLIYRNIKNIMYLYLIVLVLEISQINYIKFTKIIILLQIYIEFKILIQIYVVYFVFYSVYTKLIQKDKFISFLNLFNSNNYLKNELI